MSGSNRKLHIIAMIAKEPITGRKKAERRRPRPGNLRFSASASASDTTMPTGTVITV